MMILRNLRRIVSSKKAVLFDLDGVIADSENIKFKAYHDVFLRNFGVDLQSDACSWKGKIESEVIRSFLGVFEIDLKQNDIDTLILEKRSFYKASLDKVIPVRGVVEYITYLFECGKLLGVATSSARSYATILLNTFNIYSCFQSIVTLDDVLNNKPAPDAYRKSLDNLNCLSNEAIVFEDSPSGVVSANSAGIDVIPVLTSYEKETFPECFLSINNFEGLI